MSNRTEHQPATFESVWAALQETDRVLSEKFAETDRIIKEIAKQSAETDRIVKETSKQVGDTMVVHDEYLKV